MKKLLNYLALLSFLCVFTLIPSLNAKALEGKTFDLGKFEIGDTVNQPLGLFLYNPDPSEPPTPIGGGISLTKDAQGQLVVTGTADYSGTYTWQDVFMINSSDGYPVDHGVIINFEIKKEVPCIVEFVDEGGNQINQGSKTYKLAQADEEWLNVYSLFGTNYIPLASNPAEHYTVRSTQTVQPYTYFGEFRMNGDAPEVKIKPEMYDDEPIKYRLVCDKVMEQPYRVNYIDVANNAVVLTEQRASPDNTWVDIKKEFSASGAEYIINPSQEYPDTEYKYAAGSTPPQVCILIAKADSDNFVTYNIRCTKKQNSSGGGGSSGGGSSGGGSSRIIDTNGSSSHMISQGWILENGEWYYYSGTTRDTLKKGWHLDPQDGFWYYLETKDGRMLKGWNFINEHWYYLNPYTPMYTWERRSDGEWYYMNKENSRPLGSMYKDETTPDGFKVDSEGRYIQ